MRCDLHVHTRHSGMCHVPLLNLVCRESYNDPYDVYELLKRRGMDLVTVTDHDSIDAAESLRSRPDFFLSEEVSAELPSGNRCHIGVYGIEEHHHQGLQQRRTDAPALIAYLREQRLLFTINHVFSSLTGSRALADFQFLLDHVPAVEIRNATMLAACNIAAEEWAAYGGKAVMGGSDAHTLAPLARVYTEVPGARSRQEFLDGVYAGRARVHGQHGGFRELTRIVSQIGADMMFDNVWTCALAPLFGAVPVITGFQTVREWLFAQFWRTRACTVELPPTLVRRAS